MAGVNLTRGDSVSFTKNNNPIGMRIDVPDDVTTAKVRFDKTRYRLIVESETENEIVFRLELK